MLRRAALSTGHRSPKISPTLRIISANWQARSAHWPSWQPREATPRKPAGFWNESLAARRAALALAPGNAGYVKSVATGCTELIETLIRLKDHQAASKIAARARFALSGFRARIISRRLVPVAMRHAGSGRSRAPRSSTRRAGESLRRSGGRDGSRSARKRTSRP